MTPATRRPPKPFTFAAMAEKSDALDRLDMKFRWGNFGVRVLRCHLTQFSPGKIISFHKHSEYEFHFIPRGKGVVILDDTPYPLEDGLFYLTGPGVVHYQEADERDPMQELCLHVDIVPNVPPPAAGAQAGGASDWGDGWENAEAEQCIRLLRQFPLRPLPDNRNAMPWFLSAYRACVEKQPGSYATIKQAVTQILLRAAFAASELPAPIAVPSRDISAYRFQLAAQFIRDNYAGPITLDSVAESIPISGRQLQRIFHETGHGSFGDYVEQVRLDQVVWHLLNSEDTIEQIAERHGFSSSNYLYHVFKKRLGMTPGQYKSLHLQRLL